MSDRISGKISGRSAIRGQLHTLPNGSGTYQGVDLTDLVHGTNVERIVSLSKDEYDSLLNKDNTTLYVVGG